MFLKIWNIIYASYSVRYAPCWIQKKPMNRITVTIEVCSSIRFLWRQRHTHTHLSSFSCDVKFSDLFVYLRQLTVSVSFSVHLCFVYKICIVSVSHFFLENLPFSVRPLSIPSQCWFTVYGKICRYFTNNNERDVIEKKM